MRTQDFGMRTSLLRRLNRPSSQFSESHKDTCRRLTFCQYIAVDQRLAIRKLIVFRLQYTYMYIRLLRTKQQIQVHAYNKRHKHTKRKQRKKSKSQQWFDTTTTYNVDSLI